MRLTTIPEYVMRTGVITIFDPRQARAGANQRFVEETVRTPVGREAGKVPDGSGAILGSDASGRPVRQFNMPQMPTSAQALRATAALKESASLIRRHGLHRAVTPIVAGPLAALARGEAVVLRFSNGVAVEAAL